MRTAWLDEALEQLAGSRSWGYYLGGPAATEPTALAALALLRHGHGQAAVEALDWLAGNQQADGSLGVDAQTPRPAWPTGWAILAWQAAVRALPESNSGGPAVRAVDNEATSPSDSTSRTPSLRRWSDAAQRAVAWVLSVRGPSQPRSKLFGHDTMLQGWPWVEQTQSWVEPTAINLWALKQSGHAADTRAREAVAMLLDRMLPQGGWNYGNTVVLGTTLRAHVQPTGLALAALAGEAQAASCVQRSLKYLEQVLCARTPGVSLGFALVGGAAHGWRPRSAGEWLAAAYRRSVERGPSAYRLALLALAAGEP